MAVKNKIIWIDRGWLPVFCGFCPSERAWTAEMKRLGCADLPYPTTDGRISAIEKDGANPIYLVTISERSSQRSDEQIIGLLAHEAMHVWRYLCEAIGEDHPSPEFEAYTVQHLVQSLVAAYRDSGRGLRGLK